MFIKCIYQYSIDIDPWTGLVKRKFLGALKKRRYDHKERVAKRGKPGRPEKRVRCGSRTE
jgi:hypothetical protein